jgi:hypothetical protein
MAEQPVSYVDILTEYFATQMGGVDKTPTELRQEALQEVQNFDINEVPVKSKAIETIGYESNTKILKILFNNGGEYEYFNVSQLIADNLINAASIGGYFNATIKKGFFPFVQLN